jgi:hypothetical protein
VRPDKGHLDVQLILVGIIIILCPPPLRPNLTSVCVPLSAVWIQ